MKLLLAIIVLLCTITTLYSKPKTYPLTTCIVTDNKLGSIGRIIVKVYNNQEVKFCCKPCVSKFEKNPQKYLTKIK